MGFTSLMSFRLCNSPAILERMIDSVFRDLERRAFLCYLDDIAGSVFYSTFSEHLKSLDEVIACLAQAGQRLDEKKKWTFWKTSIFWTTWSAKKEVERPREAGGCPQTTPSSVPKDLSDFQPHLQGFMRNFAAFAFPYRLFDSKTVW